MMKSNVLIPVSGYLLRLLRASRVIGWIVLLSVLLAGAQAASPYAGFYTGYVYSSISGTITVPESAIGAAIFTVDSDGNITGNTTGTVDGAGVITWGPNATASPQASSAAACSWPRTA